MQGAQRKRGKRPDSLLALRAFLLPPRKLVAPAAMLDLQQSASAR
jgi:hypothetical protein